MTGNALLTLGLVGLDTALLVWGLRVLPREHMQILAAIPLRRRDDGLWAGINLTWYGVLQAVAVVSGIACALLLAGAAAVPGTTVAVTLGCVLAAGLPAAKLVARLVERRPGTFTVGGAVLVAVLIVPWVALGVDAWRGGDHALPTVAALAVAYPFGEGIGRLACISFGCCYGRRLADCGPLLRALFGRCPAVIVGPTRKAAYAGHCVGEPLLPVPALSALVLSAAGSASVPIFLAGCFRTAAALSLGVAFAWRFASEFLRADYRGGGRLSAYQWMALVCLTYALAAVALLPRSDRVPAADLGLALLASPIAMTALAVMGLTVFVYLGVSRMTTATIRLQVRDR